VHDVTLFRVDSTLTGSGVSEQDDHQIARALYAKLQPARTRACGSCTLCCKLIEVTELEKPQHSWCKHCKPGKGCGNYEARPSDCRTFYCGWMADLSFGDEWRPDRAKFIMTFEPGTDRMYIVCDAGFPGAWRRETFYARIKAFLTAPGMERQQIVVTTGRRLTLLVRGGEFDLGEWSKGDKIDIHYGTDGTVTARKLRGDEAQARSA
jgi:hypothetical protein